MGLFVNGNKCCFHSDSVEYLGYIIGSGRLAEPKKVKDVQSFLGFANFTDILFTVTPPSDLPHLEGYSVEF